MSNAQALLNIREGMKQLAEERERKLAEQQAALKEEAAAAKAEQDEKMTPEQMQEHITLLSKAVMDLTAKLESKGE